MPEGLIERRDIILNSHVPHSVRLGRVNDTSVRNFHLNVHMMLAIDMELQKVFFKLLVSSLSDL
jgi:hypothetical protein